MRSGTRDEDELARTAWHEAGHATAYLVQGRAFDYITTRPRSPSRTGRLCVRPRLIYPFERAVMAHCGPQAEGRYLLTKTSVDELDAEGCIPDEVITGAYLSNGREDLEIIREALAAMGGGAEDITEHVASRLVDEHWPQIERLAISLITHPTLTYQQAVNLAHHHEE